MMSADVSYIHYVCYCFLVPFFLFEGQIVLSK